MTLIFKNIDSLKVPLKGRRIKIILGDFRFSLAAAFKVLFCLENFKLAYFKNLVR